MKELGQWLEERCGREHLNEPLSQLMDKAKQLNDPHLVEMEKR